jgi:hypothetical protein
MFMIFRQLRAAQLTALYRRPLAHESAKDGKRRPLIRDFGLRIGDLTGLLQVIFCHTSTASGPKLG